MAAAQLEGKRGPRHAPDSPEDGAGRFAAPRSAAPDALSSETARELPGGLHLHFHGVSAKDVAAIIARQQEGP
jgi:hypothetical protein